MTAVAPPPRRAATILIPKGWAWDRSIPPGDQDAILDRIRRLPAWADQQLEADDLDVKPLEGSAGFFRLRVGDHRVLFRRLGRDVVVHRVEPRSRSHDGLVHLSPVPPSACSVVQKVERKNPYPARLTSVAMGEAPTQVVFRRAAELLFGTVSARDKEAIGSAVREAINAA
jgi:hypothetical protein